MQEVSAHISANSRVNLTGGNFIFKLPEQGGEDGEDVRPILLFAFGIKTDHPLKIMVATGLQAVSHQVELVPAGFENPDAIRELSRSKEEEEEEDGIITMAKDGRATPSVIQQRIDGSRPSSIIDIRQAIKRYKQQK